MTIGLVKIKIIIKKKRAFKCEGLKDGRRRQKAGVRSRGLMR